METKNLKILIVEDDAGDAELLTEIFQEAKAPFELVCHDRVSAALKKVREEPYDMVLLDLSLPESQGLDTFIKMQEGAPGLPIVILTGYEDDTLALEAMRLGAQDYLVKGQLGGKALTRVLCQAVERKRVESLVRQEVMQRTAELARANQDLARSNCELEQFAYVASHDLQEPLRKIIAFSERLKESDLQMLDKTSRDYFERMRSAGLRMKNLIEDLLHFSRVSSAPRSFENVDLEKILKEVMQDLEMRLSETGAQVEIGKLPTVKANKSQMRQLFQNLLSNAIKFSKKTDAPRIEVRSGEAREGFAEILVRDNGIGFDEKYLDRIFKPFQRLNVSSAYEGTGIGLAICQKIAQSHGGNITARSSPGVGATFIVTLPLVKD